MRRFAFLVAMIVTSAAAREHFVAPGGSPSGDGTREHPWDLATALAGPAAVQPGDTIWLRGGTYHGGFHSKLAGTEGHPIVVRQYRGERAVIDAAGFRPFALDIAGSWAWYRDFEVTNTDPLRTNPTRGSNPPDLKRGAGVEMNGPFTKLINVVVHDTIQGVGCWTPAPGAEVYGCIIYNNGWDAPDRGHGHGIYTQNRDATKRIADNIIFNQFSHGIHAYTEGGFIDNFEVEGNVCFNNGVLSKVSGPAANILVGGAKVAHNPRVIANYTYYPDARGSNNMGYTKGSEGLVLENNYFAGGALALILNKAVSATLRGNTLIGPLKGFAREDYPDNRFEKPARTLVVVRANRYDDRRYHIVVYNWAGDAFATVDLAGTALRNGDRYEIRNVQDYLGRTVTGRYGGKPIRISLRDKAVTRPVGWEAPASTLPEFGVFVLTVRPS